MSEVQNGRSVSVGRGGLPSLGRTWPLVGHLFEVMTNLPGLLKRGQSEAGPLFWVRLGPDRHLLACMDPAALDLQKTPQISNACLKHDVPDLFGGTVVVLEGAEHQRVRAVLNKPLTPAGIARTGLGEQMSAIFSEMIERWVTDQRANVYDDVREATLKVAFRMFGVDVGDVVEWRDKYHDFVQLLYGLPWDFPGTPLWRGRRAKAWLGERIEVLIDQHASDEEGCSFLGALGRGRDDHGRQLSREEVVDNVRGMLFAGHDTSSCAIAWSVYLLGQHGVWWDRLVEEANAAPSAPMSPSEMKAFPVAQALFREVLRLYPPAAFGLKTVEGAPVVAGHTLPSGATLLIPTITHLRDPELYPDPDEFKPERWLGRLDSVGARERLSFGYGPHFCVGYHIAWFEIVQFLVLFARALSSAGLRPRGKGLPTPLYLPMLRPWGKSVLPFVRV